MHVVYAACRFGYTVHAFDPQGEIICEYNAGNSSQESTSYISPDDSQAVPLDRLWHFAERSARQIASEHGIETIERSDELAASLEYELSLADDRD